MAKWLRRLLAVSSLFALLLVSSTVMRWYPCVDWESSYDGLPMSMARIMSGKHIILDQNDARIIDYIWTSNHIERPSRQNYSLNDTRTDPSRGQGQFIRKLLKNMKNGFFVEAGALDGETRSNTLILETHLNWTGLLVEGDPNNYALMKEKHRKAWTSNTCLAVKPYPHTVEYFLSFNVGKIIHTSELVGPRMENTTRVQCMPLFSLLSAINITTIDYFSLDVEGSELDVLKTIPFEEVFIKTLSVEYEHTEGGKLEILNFMKTKGYRLAGEVKPPLASWAYDVILVHNSVKVFGGRL